MAQEIEKTGGHYAVTNRYRHPSLMSYISRGSSKSRGVFNLEKTTEMLQKTLDFITDCGKKNHNILFVSTRQETVDLVRKTAENLSLPHMLNRWIGGTLSNFSNIRGRVERMIRMQKEKNEGGWTKYTKKERVLLNRELTKLENRFTGIATMTDLPKVVFVLDARKEKIAVKEASGAGIPVIGFSNADADLHSVRYPIVANIQSRDTSVYIMNLIEEAYLKGKKAEQQQKEGVGETKEGVDE